MAVNTISKDVNSVAKVIRARRKARKRRGGFGKALSDGFGPRLMTTGSTLSKQANEYANAVMNPMRTTHLAGLYPPATPSFKARAFVRGSFKTNPVDGNGFVYVSPCMARDTPSIFYTDGSEPVSSFALPNSNSTNGVIPAVINSGYTSAQLTDFGVNEINGRILLCALTVKYIGPALYEGGLQYSYVEPTHYTLSGLDESRLGSLLECQRNDVRRTSSPQFAIAVPVRNSECFYNNSTQSVPTTYSLSAGPNEVTYASSTASGKGNVSYTVGNPIMGIFVSGSAVNGQSLTFEYEYVQFAEFIGPGIAQQILTPAGTDQQGFSVIDTAIAHARQMSVESGNYDFRTNFKKSINAMGFALR